MHAHKLERIPATRIVAAPAALVEASFPAEACVLWLAADEVLILPPVDAIKLDDPYAIIAPEGNMAGIWLDQEDALERLERICEWELPEERPAFAQGAVAGIATKLWLTEDRVLFLVPGPMIEEFEARVL